MPLAHRPLVVAVPDFATYPAQSGVGRVLQNLAARWGEHLRLVNAPFEAYNVPLLRNLPLGVRVPADADLVLLPRLTGAQALRKTRGLPSIAIVHDVGIVDLPEDREGLDWFTHHNIVRGLRGLRHASVVIAVSRFSRDRLVHHLPALEDRVRVVPNGVDARFLEHDRTRAEARKRVERLAGCPLGAPLLANVGSELPRKNMPLLLQVFGRLKASSPTAQLLKVGRPGHPRWRADTVRLARDLGLQMGRDVLLLEGVDDDTLADVYRAADVFISTSLYEGFGLPALEALAVGTPVVVTDRGAFPEIVGEAGWVVEPEAERFVRAVGEALADPRPEERALAGRARAAAFSWEHGAERYLEIMGGLCRATRRAEASA